MSKILHTPKSWWRRNAKWLFPLILVIITGLYLIASGVVPFGDHARAYTDMPVFENAVQLAKQNNRVTEAIGDIEPIDKLTIAEGEVDYTLDYLSMTATITLKGRKGKCKMDISAHNANGQWQYDAIQVRTTNPVQEIVVVPAQ